MNRKIQAEYPPEIVSILNGKSKLEDIPKKQRCAIAIMLANIKLGLSIDATKAEREYAKKKRYVKR